MASTEGVGSEGFRTYAAGDNPPWGWVYAATCSVYPGDVKIGATTLTVKKRLQLFSNRWGLPTMEPLFAMYVSTPFMIEHLAQRELRHFRISGRTKGKSNEWYRIEDNPIAAAGCLLVAAFEAKASLVDVVAYGDECAERVGKMLASLRKDYGGNTAEGVLITTRRPTM